MIRDLMLASAVTILLGTAVLEAWFRVSFPGGDGVALFGLAASIAAGPLILWWRGTKPLIPISAVYCVLMCIVLLFINFQLAWGKGLVEF